MQNLHWNSFKVKFSVLLFFAVFSSPYYLTAQKCNLEGVAKLADKTDGQVTIQVLDTSGLKLLSFAVTNNSGSYSITSIPKGEAMIRFAQLGYQAKIYRFNCSGSLVTLGPDTLQTLSLDLEEISVIDKAVIFQRQGDTTQVNFRALEKGYEQSLTDILNSVPGLELRGKNYIFEGKKIDFVLLDGLDLADRNQKSLTDGVFYKSIDGIQVIDNYTAMGEDISLDSTNARRAINVKLNEEYQNKGQLSLTGKAGYKQVYNVGGNYLRVQKGKGWRLNALALRNDEAEQSDTYASDYIEQELEGQLFNNKYISVRPFGIEQLNQVPSPTVQSTSQQSIKAFYDARPKVKKSRLNANLSFTQTNSKAGYSGFRTYTDQSPQLGIRKELDPLQSQVDGKISYTTVVGSKGQFELKIPFTFDRYRLTSSTSITLVNNESDNRGIERFRQNRITPTYQFRWRYGPNWRLSIFGRTKQLTTKRSILINSNDRISIPSLSSSTPTEVRSFQNQNYRRELYENQARFIRRSENLLFIVNANSLIYRDQLTLQTEAATSRPFAGQDNWQLDLHSVGVSTRLDTKKFRLYGQLGGLIYRTSLGDLQNQRVLPAPRFLVLYRLSRRLHVSGSFREQIRLPSLEQTTQLSIQQDQIAVLSGKLSTIRPSFTRDFQVSVFKPVQAVEFPLLFNASLVYRPAYIEPQLTTRFVEGFQENKFQYVQVQREFLANVFLFKSKRERSFSLRLNASVKDFTQGEQQVRDEFISLSTTLRFFQFGRWSTQFNGQLSLLNRLEGESTISGSLNAVPELSIVYTHKNTICELAQRYLFNDFRSGTNQYHRVDFNLTRKKLFQQVEATLSVIDLLNFQPGEQAFSAFGQNYFETYSYQVLPGRILLGFKWYFD